MPDAAVLTPPVAPAPVAPPPPPPDKPKDISIEQRRAILGGFTRKEEEKPVVKPPVVVDKVEDKPKVDEKKDDKPPEPPKADTKKKQKAPADLPEPPQAPDPSELINRTAEAVGAAVAKANKDSAPKPPKEEKPELPKAVQKDEDAYRQLEKDPRYDGLYDKVVAFKKTGGVEDTYRRTWLKDNPGKKFDPDDEEHTSFYEENAPEIDVDDLDAAREKVIETRAVARAKKEMEPALTEQRTQQTQRDVEPSARKAAEDLYGAVIDVFGEEATKAANEKGWEGLEAHDPMAAEALRTVVPKIQPIAAETIRLFNGASQINPENVHPIHQEILKTALAIEQGVMSLPAEERIKTIEHNGQTYRLQFATAKQLQDMPANKRAGYWTVGQGEVLIALKEAAKRQISAEHTRLRGLVEKAGGKVSVPKTAQATATEKKEEAAPAKPNPASPSVSGSAPPPPPAAKDDGANNKPFHVFAKTMGWMSK